MEYDEYYVVGYVGVCGGVELEAAFRGLLRESLAYRANKVGLRLFGVRISVLRCGILVANS
eukprot:gene7594-15558_t